MWLNSAVYISPDLYKALGPKAAACGFTDGTATFGPIAANIKPLHVFCPETCGCTAGKEQLGCPSSCPATRATAYNLACSDAQWQAWNAKIECGSIGGRDDAVLVRDDGEWSHAYFELAVSPGSAYSISGSLYAEKQGECDSSSKALWCSLVLHKTAELSSFGNQNCFVSARLIALWSQLFVQAQ